MTEIESPRYSYVRCSYEVVPTDSVSQFHALISEIINDLIPSDNFAVLNGPNDPTHRQDKTEQEAKLIPVKFQPYPINSWRFTVFEQPLPRLPRNNRKLARLFNTLNDNETLFERLAKITQAATTGGAAGIEVTVNRIQETTRPTDAHLGKEYGSVASGITAGVSMLLETASVFYEAAHSTGIGNEIIDTKPPEEVAVPFVRLPRGIKEPTAKAFVAAAQEAVPNDGLDILFRPELSFLPNIRRSMDRH